MLVCVCVVWHANDKFLPRLLKTGNKKKVKTPVKTPVSYESSVRILASHASTPVPISTPGTVLSGTAWAGLMQDSASSPHGSANATCANGGVDSKAVPTAFKVIPTTLKHVTFWCDEPLSFTSLPCSLGKELLWGVCDRIVCDYLWLYVYVLMTCFGVCGAAHCQASEPTPAAATTDASSPLCTWSIDAPSCVGTRVWGRQQLPGWGRGTSSAYEGGKHVQQIAPELPWGDLG